MSGSRRLAALALLAAMPLAPSPSPAAAERRELGPLMLEGVPPIPEDLLERLARYQSARQALLQDWFPGGGVLILTRFGETNQVHRVAFPGADREQLSFFPEPVAHARALPDGSGFLFLADRGGAEFFQIHRQHLADGRVERLTDGRSRHGPPVLDARGRRMAFVGTGRNGRDFDVYEGPIEGPHERVLEAEGTWQVFDYSPDGRFLLVAQRVSINESEPFLLELANRRLLRLRPKSEPASYDLMRFDPRGGAVYYVSNAGGEFRTLRRLELARGEERVLSAESPWDVTALDREPRAALASPTSSTRTDSRGWWC
ncbi:MAG: hypothetical protein RML12_08745 [Xanthomonadales bacterium]|nr:hypothetical protein [Xanthomonadales bacterium]